MLSSFEELSIMRAAAVNSFARVLNPNFETQKIQEKLESAVRSERLHELDIWLNIFINKSD